MQLSLMHIAEVISQELTKLSGKKVTINDYSKYTYHKNDKPKIIIETPVTYSGGYPSHASAKRNGFGTLFRIAITEDEIIAAVYPNIIERDKANYEYYQYRHMMHRYFFETHLTDKDSIENLIQFATKKYKLPDNYYGPEEIEPEVMEKEKRLTDYLYINEFPDQNWLAT